MAKIVMLKNPHTEIKKKGVYGYSWVTAFWGPIPAFLRGDLKSGILLTIACIPTWGGAGVIWAFFYNKKYTLRLIEKGYLFDDNEKVVREARRKLGFDA